GSQRHPERSECVHVVLLRCSRSDTRRACELHTHRGVWQSHADTYGNSNANSWRSNTDSDGHVHANGYTDGDTYTDANGDGHFHFNTHSNAYARGQTYADAQAAADASPAGAAALIGTLKGGNSRNQFASSPPEMDRRAAIELAIPEKRGDGVRFGTEFPRPRKETQQEVSVGFARKSLRRCDCVIASLSIDGRLQKA